MKNILFTGSTGFLGRTLVPELKKKYYLYTPTRKELNLLDLNSMKEYVAKNNIDIVIHAAIPNLLPGSDDSQETLLKNSLQMFMNLHYIRKNLEKIIYFGSGAEFDKSAPVILRREGDFHAVPQNDYGLAKYIMNQLCTSSDNIYNLRIFGCYGPTDANFKLITYAIRCCLKKEPILLNQNCVFDYMYVMDLIPVLEFFIENTPSWHEYNVCTGVRKEIVEICELIKEKLHVSVPVIIKKEGLNHEYTGSNLRLLEEMPSFRFTDLEKGIEKQICYEKGVVNNEKEGC